MPSLLLQQLIDQFQQLPGIGPKTAQRLALHTLSMTPDRVAHFAHILLSARANLHECATCCHLAEKTICDICQNQTRQQSVICVVTDTRDVLALEKTAEFRGLYHVLKGLISPLDGIGPEQLSIDRLLKRIDRDQETQTSVEEVILALPPSIEGDTTSLYLTRILKPLGLIISRIAFGLPAGGELEYADHLTISRALSGRTLLEAS